MPLPVDTGPSHVLAVNARAQVHIEGDARAVVVGGVAVFRYTSDDPGGEAFARVLLVNSGAAKVTAVAKAFGCARLSVYRERARFDEGGIEGLVRSKPGPKHPRKLRDATLSRMLALKRQGVPNLQIAHKLGVTEGAIRAACKRLGIGPSKPETLPLLPRTASATGPEVIGSGEEAPTPATMSTEAEKAEPEGPVEPTSSLDTSAPALALPRMTGAHGGPDAWNRDGDRLLAAIGLLEEAPPQFGPAQRVRGAGALLALPALCASGLFDATRSAYGSFGRAFYGVSTIFMAMSLMALLRIRRPERLRHRSPIDLGRLLGLDRAPEVKTLRHRIAVLAGRGKSEEILIALARQRATAAGEALGFLYVDGHVRVYSGKHDLPKAHVTRLRISMPATVDHWVNDRNGDPLLVVTATPTASTAHELPGVLAQVRAAVGERQVTVVFDRGGWSPKLFAGMVEQGFDFVTYRKGRIPRVRRSRFAEHCGTFDGHEVSYALVERALRLASGLKVREVVRLSEDGEHQTSIVTSRKDLAAVEIAYRMFERWRQENFFKYMGQEFELDAMVQYGVEPADAKREVPNPLRKAKEREMAALRKEISELQRTLGTALADNEEARRPTVRGLKIANGETGQALRKTEARLVRLREQAQAIPRRVTAQEAAGDGAVVRLRTESKRLTDVVKMVAYQAESALARMVTPHYRRADDEGRKLLASAFDLAGDFEVVGDELRVTLEPAASPNRTKAITALCAELNATDTCYPATNLRLRYSIRNS
jgi:transposase